MNCPNCGHKELKVLETREPVNCFEVKRRRICLRCNSRFVTIEAIEPRLPVVTKKNGEKEKYSSEKIYYSILKATNQLEISNEKIEKIVDDITSKISLRPEITTYEIGHLVLEELRKTNDMAYIKYLMAFDRITDISRLAEEIKKITKEDNKNG